MELVTYYSHQYWHKHTFTTHTHNTHDFKNRGASLFRWAAWRFVVVFCGYHSTVSCTSPWSARSHCAYAAVRKAVDCVAWLEDAAKARQWWPFCCLNSTPQIQISDLIHKRKHLIFYFFLKHIFLYLLFTFIWFFKVTTKSLNPSLITEVLYSQIMTPSLQLNFTDLTLTVGEHGFQLAVIFLLYSLGPHCLQRPVCPPIRALKSVVAVI